MLMSVWNAMRRGADRFLRDEDGAGTVEMIMIIAVVIIVAILFRDQLLSFVKSLMGKVEKTSNDMFS